MSRSVRKFARGIDSVTPAKKQANRKIRHYKGEISNGSSYRKIYESWNINDWKGVAPITDRPELLRK